jgi:hypothetical protein
MKFWMEMACTYICKERERERERESFQANCGDDMKYVVAIRILMVHRCTSSKNIEVEAVESRLQ